MAGGRTERCSGCGRLLAVPGEARAIRCAVCGTVMSIQPYGKGRQKRSWLKEIISQLTQGPMSQQWGSPSPPRPMSSYGGGSSAHMASCFPKPEGNRRALLIGVSYKRRPYELKGTVNDVLCMKHMLLKQGFDESYIVVMTEEQRQSHLVPTRANMLAAMRWLVRDCKWGDSLVFHFSGHGSQQLDTRGEEVDGFDETLCPVDYEYSGMIVDNEINTIMVRPLTEGVKLHAIIDSCHSGTALDLPFLCRMGRTGYYQWEDHSSPKQYKGTSGGLAISFSGCDDHQTSADTNALAVDATTGAMTFSFIQAIDNEPGATYGRLLTSMRSAIRNANTCNHLSGPIAHLLRRVFQTGLTQEPQLCSSEIFDIYRKPFII